MAALRSNDPLEIQRWVETEMQAPFKLPEFTVAGMPSASFYRGCAVFVSDGASNKLIAISDGTNWRYADGNTV
jgi:hypothetical protein